MDILKTPIPQSVLDTIDGYIANKLALTQFNTTNVFTSTDIVTANVKSGVVNFTTTVSNSPSSRDYIINNSFIEPTTPLNIQVFCDADDTYASILGISKGVGYIRITMNDGGTGNGASPIVQFQILN